MDPKSSRIYCGDAWLYLPLFLLFLKNIFLSFRLNFQENNLSIDSFPKKRLNCFRMENYIIKTFPAKSIVRNSHVWHLSDKTLDIGNPQWSQWGASFTKSHVK
uniref:Uncharacterized protein n=1 Tax=Lutzomyia longipalpis TaxID=7200 RepID=A0A1B0FV31_LUTLO